ncbi:DNA cytosine methyltransferase [Bacillus sp. CMF21]|nr:DNA cytosine methyltransferase [Bacillus sp. CMF21]
MDIGLERAGFKTNFTLDIDKHCKEIVDANRDKLGDFPHIIEDINTFEPKDKLEKVGMEPGQVALFSGGPPCQPFSKSGLRKGIEDERGSLFERYLEYLEVIQPKAFILENVRGLYSSRKGEDFKIILKLFEESGYTIYWTIIDAANYGVPQFRQRLFIVGFKDRIIFKFPEETHFPVEEIQSLFEKEHKQPFTTVYDAIGDLTGNVKYPDYNGKYAHLLSDIPEGMNYSQYTEERGHPNPIFEWRSKFWYFLLKIDRYKPSLTIQAQPGNNTGTFHWENRDEIKRLQSFPDWLSIDKSYSIAHRMIGNAVPPLLSELLGKSIIEALESKEEINEEEYYELREKSDKKAAKVRSGRGSGKGKVNVNITV